MEQTHVTVKTSIRDLIHDENTIIVVDTHVRFMHALVTHAYALAKLIFLDNLTRDPIGFEIGLYLNQKFFERIFLTLVGVAPQRVTEEEQNRINLIQFYLPLYIEISHYSIIHVPYFFNCVSYEGTHILTAYHNNAMANFGKLLRRVINVILDVDTRKANVRDEMEGNPENNILEQIRIQVTNPARQFKQWVTTNNVVNIRAQIAQNFGDGEQAALFNECLNQIQPLLVYPPGYQFQNNSNYEDSKANPLQHFKSYFLLSQFLHNRDLHSYKCFPLRKSLIPCYTMIDITSLIAVLFRQTSHTEYDLDEVIRHVYPGAIHAKKVLRGQQVYEFRGTIHTDRVGVSILNVRHGVPPAGRQQQQYIPNLQEREFPAITTLSINQLNGLGTDVAFLDLGRQDLLYGMMHLSGLRNKITFQYTRSDRSKVTGMKAARNQRNGVPEHVLQNLDVHEGFQVLSATVSTNLSIEDFVRYITAKAHPSVINLYNFYATYTAPGRDHPLFRKLRLSAYFGKVKEELLLADSIRNALRVNNLIVGNWSAGNANQRYHEPIKGIGLLGMLRHAGFRVNAIDEFCTSKFCADCQQELTKPFWYLKGRPYRRLELPFTRCHGLLRCNTSQCRVVSNRVRRRRVWNRDLNAVRNFRTIYDQFRSNRTIPPRFTRGQ